jgi:integrase
MLTVRRFALTMHAEDGRHEIPAPDALGNAVVRRRSPYIYTPDEIDKLIRAAAALRPAGSMRPLTYVTLLGLLDATGMRISEALALNLDDVMVDGLLVRETKFQKSRLLPLHATTERALNRYLVTRAKLGCLNRALFVSGTGGQLSYNTVKGVFLQLLKSAGLEGVSSPRKPRIHDLRHTFAVRSLEQYRHDRDAVAPHIVALSTVNGPRNLLTLGRAIFPTWRGRRSAV